MGHDSHGVIRVQPYVGLLQVGQDDDRQRDQDHQGCGCLDHRRRPGRLRPGCGQAGDGPRDRAGARARCRGAGPVQHRAHGAGSAPGPSRPRPPAWSRCTSATPRASASRWRPSAAPTGGCRSTRSRWAVPRPGQADRPRHVDGHDRRRQDPRRAQQGLAPARGRHHRQPGPPDHRPRGVLRRSAGRDHHGRRPQGLRPCDVRRDPGGVAHRGRQQPSGRSDRRSGDQQPAFDPDRPGAWRVHRHGRRHRPAGRLGQGIAAGQPGRRGADAG